MLKILNRYKFLIVFIVFAVTFFTRNNLKGAGKIVPEVLTQPRQTEVYEHREVAFTRDGYRYHLMPICDYEINGLVVGKMDYRFFSIDRNDSVFPIDICIIWGDNVARKLYKNSAVSFSQDCRWCWAQWSAGAKVNLGELSNNHLLINDKEILRQAKDILRGDQIKIRGLLVNVIAEPEKELGLSARAWNTSISRIDNGAGACEVIYVQNMEILKKSNLISRFLFRLSGYALLLIMIWGIINFFRGHKSAEGIR